MVTIQFSDQHVAEKQYVFEVLFGDLLGLPVEFKIVSGFEGYLISGFGNVQLWIRDSFFSNFDKELGFLNRDHIPKDVIYLTCPFSQENIVVLYGEDTFVIDSNYVRIGADIVASTFFMLTRWEEFVEISRDSHDRFSVFSSLAFKMNFLHRPVVNEYASFLKRIFEHFGFKCSAHLRSFKVIPSHDIDTPHWISGNVTSVAKHVLYRLLMRLRHGPVKENNEFSFLLRRLFLNQDPFDTFDFLMKISGEKGCCSEFYWMGAAESQYDNGYSVKEFETQLKNIYSRGHVIGFHPGYYTYNNSENWSFEYSRLMDLCSSLGIPSPKVGRQHYLRFRVPDTWQIWNDMGMEIDSTLGYPEQAGFRCGICVEFPVFNFLTRKKLKLRELPLLVMEGTFLKYQPHKKIQDVRLEIMMLKETVKKYQGVFTILVHNTTVSNLVWPEFRAIYPALIN